MTETISGASQPDIEVIKRAQALTPALRASAADSEANRRLSDEDIAALSEAHLFELCVPKRLGGLQTNVRTLVDVIAAVAYGNGAAGWVVSLVNTSAWMAALFPEQAQQDIWAGDPGERVATIFDAAGTAVPVVRAEKVALAARAEVRAVLAAENVSTSARKKSASSASRRWTSSTTNAPTSFRSSCKSVARFSRAA